MIRPRTRATWLANQSVVERFRQTTVMSTHEFAQWLRQRDVSLDEETLVLFAATGIFLPVGVAPSKAIRSGRHVRASATLRGILYGDTGRETQPADLRRRRASLDPDALLWHPFQLWYANSLVRIMSAPTNIGPASVLTSPASYASFAKTVHKAFNPSAQLVEFAASTQADEFDRILAVTVAAEPLVIGALTGAIRFRMAPGEESWSEYGDWQDSLDHARVLGESGADIDLLRKWHEQLAISAELEDPVAAWRELIRYAPREKRLRFTGAALRAEETYYLAELIRRYLERFHGVTDLPDEDQVRLGPQVAAYKERLFGKSTTTDGDRSVFRNVVRQFHLDPQPRFRWLVEGATEAGFIREWARLHHIDLDRAGIELVLLGSASEITSERATTLLKLSRDEQVFAFASIDSDNDPEHARVLRNLANQQLLPAGWLLFQPDFEEGNFSLGELADAATLLAGMPEVKISVDDIALGRRVDKPIWDAVGAALRNHFCYASKGENWGRCLARIAHEAEGNTERAIVKAFSGAVRGNHSNYRFTLTSTVVADDGTLASPPGHN